MLKFIILAIVVLTAAQILSGGNLSNPVSDRVVTSPRG
ncbi:hypothetical protein HNP46_000306 [Pseudomonas nitritireducens]|uniref:Uncharacterized protein n=1 Tax=Pseudomonas nitroreducens TaxID=46680 RepID=A0A7W7KFD6_PSENT|nr:hypothetical protein [Pseudomonas nitritireducens]